MCYIFNLKSSKQIALASDEVGDSISPKITIETYMGSCQARQLSSIDSFCVSMLILYELDPQPHQHQLEICPHSGIVSSYNPKLYE